MEHFTRNLVRQFLARPNQARKNIERNFLLYVSNSEYRRVTKFNEILQYTNMRMEILMVENKQHGNFTYFIFPGFKATVVVHIFSVLRTENCVMM